MAGATTAGAAPAPARRALGWPGRRGRAPARLAARRWLRSRGRLGRCGDRLRLWGRCGGAGVASGGGGGSGCGDGSTAATGSEVSWSPGSASVTVGSVSGSAAGSGVEATGPASGPSCDGSVGGAGGNDSGSPPGSMLMPSVVTWSGEAEPTMSWSGSVATAPAGTMAGRASAPAARYAPARRGTTDVDGSDPATRSSRQMGQPGCMPSSPWSAHSRRWRLRRLGMRVVAAQLMGSATQRNALLPSNVSGVTATLPTLSVM